MNGDRTIAVDIGNSAAKVMVETIGDEWVGDGPAAAETRGVQRFDFQDGDWATRLVDAVRGDGTPSTGGGHHWVTASVNRPASRVLRDRVAHRFPKDRWRELTRADVPLATEVRNPDTLGIDRLLGAYSAVCLVEQPAVISIDAGSAVTVDLIRDECFLGGAIFPGVRLQLTALNQGTDRLPAIVGTAQSALEVPGRDTVAAMRCGVLIGVAGAIERLVANYSASLDDAPAVVLTGGDADRVAPLLSFPVRQIDGLVLLAILRIASAVRIE